MTTAAEKLKAAAKKAADAAAKKVTDAAAKKALVAAKKKEMADAKKLKAAEKKAADKAAAAEKKANMVVYTFADVVLTTKQTKTLEMVGRNQERIYLSAQGMMKLAADSGKRLHELKEQITLKYGNVWKAWVQEAGVIAMGYEMCTRYMKLAEGEQLLIDNDMHPTSVVEAVKQIEYIKKPEKKAAAEAKAAQC